MSAGSDHAWPAYELCRVPSAVTSFPQLIGLGQATASRGSLLSRLVAQFVTGFFNFRLETVQFRPSYAHEDSIEGIRPRVTVLLPKCMVQRGQYVERRRTYLEEHEPGAPWLGLGGHIAS